MKTRGQRDLAASQPTKENFCHVIHHDDHSHLIYALELPEYSGELQAASNIEDEVS